MTPFELTLKNDLDIERQRFGSEWTFQWHKLNMEGKAVDVDRFHGGRIYLGGIRFESQQQGIFWQALGRYLNGKVHETFRKWDEATEQYPPAARRSSLEGTGQALRIFVAGVVSYAVKTDQALRGRGQPKTDVPSEGTGVQAHANAEVLRLVEAHSKLLPDDPAAHPVQPSKAPSLIQRWEKWYADNKATIWVIGILVTLAGIAAKVFL